MPIFGMAIRQKTLRAVLAIGIDIRIKADNGALKRRILHRQGPQHLTDRSSHEHFARY